MENHRPLDRAASGASRARTLLGDPALWGWLLVAVLALLPLRAALA